MLGFLKVFARGIICTVLLPVILLVWVLYGVYCLVLFLVMFVNAVISFFAGNNGKGEMKEDIEAKKILEQKAQAEVEQAQVISMMYQQMTTQQAMQQQMMQQQQMQPQPMQQPVQQPQENIPQENDFDPFTPSESEEQPSNEVTNNEGDLNNGQSY